ncbi:MAG: hypothetical protein IJ463_02425 [Bacilli bacterium]|nr:hypothetical protein [Bacilli bacterium]
MKKIFKLFILVFVCFLPVMVEAEVKFEFENEYLNQIFTYRENNEEHYINLDSEGPLAEDSILVYDKDNNIIKKLALVPDGESFDSPVELFKNKDFSAYLNVMADLEGMPLISEDDYLYAINYEEGSIQVNSYIDDSSNKVYFEDDLSFTKEVLGKKYDIYAYYNSLDYIVNYIKQYDNYYVVYYNDGNVNSYVSILNNMDEIFNLDYLTYDEMRPIVYIYDYMIYVMEDIRKLKIYKDDGYLLYSLNINHEAIDELENDDYCSHLAPAGMNIIGNNLYIIFFPSNYSCSERIEINDVTDLVKGILVGEPMTLKYYIDYDVNAITSNDGDFTYEIKEDDNGESYVDLRIEPKDGYSVEEIIVTDVNGNRIDVTNNRFLKPLNDVKVEVKYVKGEYLPIPDTFLGKSVSLIIIGVILISLGFYTINYVRQE